MTIAPEERVLDWRPHPDLKSFGFMISALDEFQSGLTKDRVRRHKNPGIYLDQGSEGACTGFGFENCMALGPNRYPSPTNDKAFAVYHLARQLDEWPGEAYEGSSVNGAMKAGRQLGYVSVWHWCLTLAEIDYALSYKGAVECGSNWYSGMWNPDADGYLHVTGTVVGGHAWAISGRRKMDNGRIRYRMENSWGQDWGRDGGAFIWAEDLQRLLSEGAEFSCPTKAFVG